MDDSFVNASEINSDRVYALVEAIYGNSVYFSDSFKNKFPTLENFNGFVKLFSSVPGSHFYLVSAGSDLAGYVQIERRSEINLAHTGYLNLGVHPAFQKRGLGKKLLQKAWQLIEADGYIEIVYLMVRSDNLPAIKLYDHSGFEKIALLPSDTKTTDGKYYDGVLMRKYTKCFSKHECLA